MGKTVSLFCERITTYNPMKNHLIDDIKPTEVLGCGGLCYMTI